VTCYLLESPSCYPTVKPTRKETGYRRAPSRASTASGYIAMAQWSPESSVGPSDNCASRLDPRERIHGTRELLKGAAEPGETQMNGRKHTPGHRVQTLRKGERLIGELKYPKSGHRPLCTLPLERRVISPRPVTS